jgi:DNA-directed RNA polymerase subunit RPC12/RpoP
MSEGMAFYRCVLCGNVVSIWDIKEHHGCSKCKNNKIRPTELSLLEKILQIIKHPTIWNWNKVSL